MGGRGSTGERRLIPRRYLSALRAAQRLILLVVLATACSTQGPGLVSPNSPYVVTPAPVALAMLTLAGVTPDDVVYDLGSGDGRLVVAAAERFGARGVGVELDANLVRESGENALRAGVSERVTFLWRDLFATDVSAATVVTLYLGEPVNLRLRPKLLSELRPGTRVVSHAFGMADWQPDRVERYRDQERASTLYLWIVPAAVEGTWRFTLPAAGRDRACTLRLAQRFQSVHATLTVDGAEIPVERVALVGDHLRIATAPQPQADWPSLVLDGRLADGEIRGEVARAPTTGEVVAPWRARRD
jgi:Ribosomal protein L11 methyltransferase (PrmA)